MPAARDVELAAIRGAIHRAGLRCTAPRIAVLDRLRQIAAPVTRKTLAAALSPLGFNGASIYRNLKDLTDVAMVVCLDLGDHVRRYEVSSPGATGIHPHFVCTACSKIFCLTGRDVKVTLMRGARHGHVHVASVSQLLIRGTCKRCASASRARPRGAPGACVWEGCRSGAKAKRAGSRPKVPR